MTEKFARKFYIITLIVFMIAFILGAISLFISPNIPIAAALIYSGVILVVETICFKYLFILLHDE